MTDRAEFVRRQHEEARATLELLREHSAALEEKTQEDGKGNGWEKLKSDVDKGIAELEPVLTEFDRADVDPEELIEYAQTIETWQAKEKEIAAALAKKP